MKPRAFSYTRFSTPEQQLGDSLRRQTDMALRYAAQHGLTLDESLAYHDKGTSAFRGDNAKGGALALFLRAVEDEDVPAGSVLLVETADRLSRLPARKALRILESIIEGGVDVVFLDEGKRYGMKEIDGPDLMFFIMKAIRGNEESQKKSERNGAAWAAKRERKSHAGYGKTLDLLTRSVPGWIQKPPKDATTGKPKLDPKRARVVKRIFQMFVAGTGKAAIAKKLNAERVPTFGSAAMWHSSYVYKILQSESVIGTMTPHIETHAAGKMVRVPQTPIEGYYPAAIDPELWERAQTLLTTSAAQKAQVRVAVQNILGGLAKCPACGSTMTRIWKGVTGGDAKLVCVRAKAGSGCRYVSVSLPAIEAALVRNADMTLPLADQTLEDEIRSADAALDGTLDEIEQLVAAIAKKPLPTLIKALAAHEQIADKIRANSVELQQKAVESDTHVVKRRAARLKAALSAVPLDRGKANTALRETLSRVTVDYDSGELRLHWRHDGETRLLYDPTAELEDLTKKRAG